jgi:hypothetical protein
MISGSRRGRISFPSTLLATTKGISKENTIYVEAKESDSRIRKKTHLNLISKLNRISLKPGLSLIPCRTNPDSDPTPIAVGSNSRHIFREFRILPKIVS